MNNVEQLRAEQRQYVASQGGYLNIREADGTYNDLNRRIADSFLSVYGKAYIGSVNFYGSDRTAVANGTMSPFKEYHGQDLHNFSCDYIIPNEDDVLKNMICEWNSSKQLPADVRLVTSITDRILSIGGDLFVWY